MLKRIIPTTIALSLLAPTIPALASVSPSEQPIPPTYAKYQQNPKPILRNKFWEAIATCETGFNLNHSTPSYTSALGINRRTWRTWNNTKTGLHKTWQYQKWVAENIAFRGYYKKNQHRFIYPVGVWGWACLRKGTEAHRILCNSQHPLVQRWKRDC